MFLQFTKSLSSKLEGNHGENSAENDNINSISGVAVASVALKGVSGLLMDKIRDKKITNISNHFI